MSREEALRRLGVFSVGDRVVFTPMDFLANDEQYVVVLRVADDEAERPHAALGHLQVQVEDEAWADGRPIIKWVMPSSLRHRRDLREEALRRLQSVVHLQTEVMSWAVKAMPSADTCGSRVFDYTTAGGVIMRDGDPLCGASGGQMVRAEARVTCPACREQMATLPRR